MIHLYHGDGKGKTTAACGLALRAAGSGMKILFVQFLKDGSSSELAAMRSAGGIAVRLPEVFHGWYRDMTEAQRAETERSYTALIRDISPDDFDMLVLDEAVAACRYGLIDRAAFLSLLNSLKDKKEIVLTGRDPSPELMELADYITEMKKEKHPFDSGIPARRGIEY